MVIFYHIGFFKAFQYFCEGSTYCKTYCGENNCILFSYPAYHVERIKTCSKIPREYSIDQIIVNNNLTQLDSNIGAQTDNLFLYRNFWKADKA